MTSVVVNAQIRKLFNLSKEDDIRKYTNRKNFIPENAEKKPKTRVPKIQRLVNPLRLQRKRRAVALQRRKRTAGKEQKAEYNAMMFKPVAEKKAAATAARSADKNPTAE